MSKAEHDPIIQGWCPGALRPMASGDGLVVRVRAPMGRFAGDILAEIAVLAKHYGNGLLDVTQRANLQIRGVQEQNHTALIDALRPLGLLDETAALEARRNVLITPWFAGDETRRLAKTLVAILPDLPPLPGKFGYAIDTGPLALLQAAPADIRLEYSVCGQLILRADGARYGRKTALATLQADLTALVAWFLQGGVREGRGRMAAYLACGATLPADLAGDLAPRMATPPPKAGRLGDGLVLAAPFGQITAQDLAALARLAGDIRMTPWRAFYLPGLQDAPDLAGLISLPEDPRLRIFACSGAPRCPQAHQPVRVLANRLAKALPAGESLHVSGCTKGCAATQPHATTLVATPEGFDLIKNGCASDRPGQQALKPEDVCANPRLIFGAHNAS